MSLGGDEGEIGFATARGRDWPSVRQFSVFLENRLGGLLDVVRRFESTDVRIISLTIIDSADCAIIRIVLSDPERAYEIMQQAKLSFIESDLLVVQLPDSQQPLVDICKALLTGEVSLHYAYPLMVGPMGHAAIAIHVEDIDTAGTILQGQGFVLLSENDLQGEESS